MAGWKLSTRHTLPEDPRIPLGLSFCHRKNTENTLDFIEAWKTTSTSTPKRLTLNQDDRELLGMRADMTLVMEALMRTPNAAVWQFISFKEGNYFFFMVGWATRTTNNQQMRVANSVKLSHDERILFLIALGIRAQELECSANASGFQFA